MPKTVVPRQASGGQADLPAAVEEASFVLVELTMAALAIEKRLSTLQLRVLLAVAREGSVNLRRLAATLDASVSSASRLVDRLVSAGLLDRGVAAHSRREVDLRLTQAGRRTLASLHRRRQRAIAAVLDRMSTAERRALLAGLAGFTAAAGRTSAAEAEPRP